MPSTTHAPKTEKNPSEHTWVVCFDGYDDKVGWFEGQYCSKCGIEADGSEELEPYDRPPKLNECPECRKCPVPPHKPYIKVAKLPGS